MKYHITNVSNSQSIIEGGLKANEDGEIFLFDNISIEKFGVQNYVSDYIAHNQLFLDEFVMIEVDERGVKNPLEPDDCGEYSEPFQYVLRQKSIKPKFLKFFGHYQNENKSF